MSSGDDLNENDLWQIKSGTVVWEFGKALTLFILIMTACKCAD